MRQLLAYIRLTRFKECTFFVTITTLLGAACAEGKFGWPLVLIWLANWLAVMFAFMINDVEDAEDDALNPKKVNRNPVSARDLTPRKAWIASLAVALLSAAIFFFCGFWPFALGFLTLALGFLYSWRKIRLKNIAFLDMASHCMMLGGLQFLAGYTAFDRRPVTLEWLFPFFFIVAISLYGELFNELRDLEGDIQAGLRHTVVVLGRQVSYWLMMGVLAAGILCGLVTFFFLEIIPTWVVLLLGGALAILIALTAYRVRRQRNGLALQESFQKPVEMAGAFALSLQFTWPLIWKLVGPWVVYIGGLKLF